MFSWLRHFFAPPTQVVFTWLAVESLEQRCLLSTNITLDPTTGVVTIRGSSSGDQAYADVIDLNTLRISLNSTEIERFPLARVRQIDFIGSAGDDLFLNRTSVRSKALGGNGNDRLTGGYAIDQLYGDDGNDELDGRGAADLIYGGYGNDTMYGGDGNDRLLGGGDADKLFGGNGDDRLFGGAASVSDWLTGNLGRDRFLLESADVIVDWSNLDAKLTFSRGNVNWTAAEIEVLDGGFQILFQQTNNNVLLRDSLDATGIKLVKYSALPGGALSINRLQTRTENGRSTYTRVIEIRDWNERDPIYNEYLVSTIVHEVGHNWDSIKEIGAVAPSLQSVWTAFLKLSGWTQTQPANLSLYNRSTDGRWWYLKTAEFAQAYGRANPYEDWSRVWEHNAFRRNEPVGRNLQAKLVAVRSLFAGLAKLA